MKKRILLSLVSFFMMTAMWASLVDAYQIYVTAANGKTGSTAQLTLNMKNRNAIGTWSCTLVLPEGVTYKEAALVDARYPEGYAAEFTATDNGDGTVTFSCSGADDVAITGTDGAIAIVTVDIAATAPVGDCVVNVTACSLVEPGEDGAIHDRENNEFNWTIEQGEVVVKKGDVNCDDEVDIADAVSVLNAMAGEEVPGNADVNGDGEVDIADFVSVLNIMAGEEI